MTYSKKLKVVFCGTPDFSIPTLKTLAEHPQIDLVKVITMPDRPAGRGKKLTAPPVAVYAAENSLPLFQTENINDEESLLTYLEEEKVDLFIVIAFAQFLGERILTLPRLGCYNIHTSLLPKYRGAAPIQYALLNGDKETGVTIQKMVKKMDAGDIVIQNKIPLSDSITGGELYGKLMILAGESVHTLIDKIIENSLEFNAQDESQVSYAPALKKIDGLLKFGEKTVEEVLNQIRALHPWPGTYSFLNGKRMKIIRAIRTDKNVSPGVLDTSFQTLTVGCKNGSIRLTEVQLEGKKVCSDTNLLNGLKNLKEPLELTS